MAKKLQMYQMHISELLAKKELIRIMQESNALWMKGKFPSEIPALVWNEYIFLSDGENWYFQRPYYKEGTYHNGMEAYAKQFKLEATHQYLIPFADDEPYSYEELTELITSEIEIIPNLNRKEEQLFNR